MRRRTLAAALGAVAVVAIVAGGCGTNDNPAITPAKNTTTTVARSRS